MMTNNATKLGNSTMIAQQLLSAAGKDVASVAGRKTFRAVSASTGTSESCGNHKCNNDGKSNI
jgi:hypothetical protein